MTPSKAATGIAGLDDILRGGFPSGRVLLVEGDPGVGKTTLALHFLMEGAKRGEPSIYVTLSETREELLQVAASHGWELNGIDIFELAAPEAFTQEEQNTLFHPSEVELAEMTRSVTDLCARVNPRRLVFDSLSEIRLLAQSALRYRREVLALKQFFAGRNCTVLLLDDRTDKTTDNHLQSIAHGVVSLDQLVPLYGSHRRRMRVAKMRGVDFRGGYHDFVIREGGIDVFPRLVAAEHAQPVLDGTASSGVPALDAMLAGGLDRGTSALFLGTPGTGKSALATQWALAAATRGERAAIYAFDESLATLERRSVSLGLDLPAERAAGRIVVRQIDPAEVAPGELTHEIRDSVEKEGIRLVVIDSLNGYLNAMPEESFLVLQLHELLGYLGRKGVVTILVVAQTGLVGTMASPIDVTYLADTVLLLRHFEATGDLHRAISVMKKRTGGHESTIRELHFGRGGVSAGEPLHQFRGVLTGVPTYVGTPAELTDSGARGDVADASALERRVLVLAPSGRDAALASQVLEQAQIAAVVCEDVAALIAAIDEGAGAAVLANEALTPPVIAALADHLRPQPAWSDFPLLIFTARAASASENRRTLEAFADLGNVTALERPVHPLTMVSATRAALRARARQYAARAVLLDRERDVRQRDEFLALLGHELRNPLGALRNAATMVERSASDGPGLANVDRPLAIIDRQLRHLTQLVDDLLDVARVTSGKIALKAVPVDLVAATRAMVDEMGKASRERRLQIDVRAPSGAVVVMADPVRLDQILTNLLTNALKYTPSEGRIDVSVGVEQGEAVLRVADTGVGLSAEMLPTIFEPFTQAARTLDQSQGGIGLGLSVVRALARLHGGDVAVTSEGLGRGSEFVVRLPHAPSARVEAAVMIEAEAPVVITPRHILIVEDGADNRESLQELLEGMGHRVDTAIDGERGVEQALSCRPEVALVDIGLPRLDGYEVARRIRGAMGSKILLIALTGYGQPDDRARAAAAGFDVHITKPLDFRTLERLIAGGQGGRLH